MPEAEGGVVGARAVGVEHNYDIAHTVVVSARCTEAQLNQVTEWLKGLLEGRYAGVDISVVQSFILMRKD